MAAKGFEQTLCAVLRPDVKGYSRLMRDDDDATIRNLTAYRTAIARLVQQYRERVVDASGDNVLAEVSSITDEVNCAVEMRWQLAERNAELNYERRWSFESASTEPMCSATERGSKGMAQ